MKSRPDKMRLLEVDADIFGDVLGLIDDYEGWFCPRLVIAIFP